MEAASQDTQPARVTLVARTIRDSFVFTGRATRTEALLFMLLATVFGPTSVAIAADGHPLAIALGLCWGLLWTVPEFAVFVRRMHDLNRSAWWVLIHIGMTAAAVLLFLVPGDGRNFRVQLLIWEAWPAWTSVSAPLILGLTGLMLAELFLFFQPGTPGPNRYGPDPRADRNAPATAPA